MNSGTCDCPDDLGPDGSIFGGRTCTPVSTLYTYSIDGGSVSGTNPETAGDTYSYDCTP